jgi:signal transduction histidine kinase/CheY-like chemotaxis protein
LDPATRQVLDLNARASAIIGYRLEELSGALEDHLTSDDSSARREWRDRFALAMSAHSQLFEWQIKRKSELLSWLEVHMQRTVISGQVLVVAFARPIDDRRQTEELEMQLMVSDRMASVGILAASVAHEINNPLASVVVNLDLALQDLAAANASGIIPPELLEELADAKQAAERVRVIVRDLRVFSRAQEDKRGPVDVENVIDSSVRMAWNEIRHRARLVRRYASPPAIEASESRLGQVFLNLIVNAAQAIREGDYQSNVITISTSLDQSNRVLVTIEDTGSGMSPETQKRLFTPFFTTKPAGVGTGLGLALCKKIVDSLGGEISWQSEVGKGTKFTLAFPASSRKAEPVRESMRPVVPASRRGRILVVDDDEMFAQAVRRVLASEHTVTWSPGANAALQLLRRGERFDVILCDVMMPQITGVELYRTLLLELPEEASKVVFISGGPFTPLARQFFDEAHNHRLEKPISARDLRALINELIQ